MWVKLYIQYFVCFSLNHEYWNVLEIYNLQLHILTSNNFLYTTDQRFSVIHPQDSDEWNLKIEYAQPKDEGTYTCQVKSCTSFSFFIFFCSYIFSVYIYKIFFTPSSWNMKRATGDFQVAERCIIFSNLFTSVCCSIRTKILNN